METRIVERTIAVAVSVWLLSSGAARAQNVIGGTEDLEFDRPEAWAMKYYASLSLLTSMGVPERMEAGAIDLGFEGGIVPQLSDDQRRVGFNGTKLENLNRTHFIGRVRAHIGLPASLRLELAYLPPLDVGGVEPNLFAIGVGRAFALTESFQLGARGYFQTGTIRGDITCGEDEAAAGDDLVLNPFECRAPSNDELRQRVGGGEITAGYVLDDKWRPYAGLALNYLDLEFQVDAVYGELEDRVLELTDGTTVSVTGGVQFVASEKWRFTGEAFYSWLSVARPDTSSANDGFLNARFLVTYRLR